MIKLLTTLLLGYAALVLLLYLLQRTMLYFPTPAMPGDNVQTLDGDFQIVVVDGQDESHAVVYFGGNAESVGDSSVTMQRFFGQSSQYYLNYPGYGGSAGSPSEASLYSAASVLLEHVLQRHEHITVVGRSLGSGVATYIAANYPVANLVLITPYDSIVAVAATHYPIFPVRWLVKDRYDSLSRAEKITANTLFLVAAHDRIIPPKHSENLYRAWDQRKARYATIKNADHNDIHLHPEFAFELSRFLQP